MKKQWCWWWWDDECKNFGKICRKCVGNCSFWRFTGDQDPFFDQIAIFMKKCLDSFCLLCYNHPQKIARETQNRAALLCRRGANQQEYIAMPGVFLAGEGQTRHCGGRNGKVLWWAPCLSVTKWAVGVRTGWMGPSLMWIFRFSCCVCSLFRVK